MIKKLLNSCAIVLALGVGTAAYADDNFEEELLEKASQEDDRFFVTLAIENDRIGDGEDRFYTNGFRLSFMETGAPIPDVIDEVVDELPFMDINNTTSVSYSVGQNIYTPSDIKTAIPDPNDRPYAAWLYGSVGLVTLDDDIVDEVELSVGVVGPSAMGEKVQSEVHHLFDDSPDPKGWEYQLDNEPGVVLSWERRYPEAYKLELDDWYIGFQPSFGVALGNVHTHAEAGLFAKFGLKDTRWQDMPVRVRPSMPGTGYFLKPSPGDINWFLFGGVSGRAVGRNIFLDGNTFEESPSVDKKHFVWDANIGVSVNVGRNRLSYTMVRRSKEFHGQDEAALFGALSLTRRF